SADGALPDQPARTGTECGGFVLAVVEAARRQREAPAADARVELIAQTLELGDAIVEQRAPRRRHLGPVGGGGGSLVREGRQRVTDLSEAQPELLGDPDERHAAQLVTVVAPLPAVGAVGV